MSSGIKFDSVELVVSAIPRIPDFPIASVFNFNEAQNEIVPVETFNVDPAKNNQQNYEDIIQKLTQDRQKPCFIMWKQGQTPVLMVICMDELPIRLKMLFRSAHTTINGKLQNVPSIFGSTMAELEYKNFIKLVPAVQEPLP
ncbi:uncharacterized protein LOC143294771 [Babylonia areolata]|uniref:uncharacterized protein LOC143294771 n=1 Tax=Babylonia areolata TaxID=304850 RepID=UPI003FD0CB74